MKGKKKNVRAADVKSRLLSDEGPSPFSSIVLKEKKEEPKKAPNKIQLEKKKPGEIVQGYDRNASFADILFAYEHTGSPYQMPSQKRQQEIRDNKKTDFGAILDKWEGKANGKKADKPMKKSENKVNKSFADIFAEYESSASSKQVKKEMAEKTEKKAPLANPFFVEENEEDQRSRSAAWSIYGSNEAVKREVKPEAKKDKAKPVEIKKSEKYVAKRDFSEILAEYADGKTKKTVAPPAKPEKTVLKKAEEKPASVNPFFLEESDEDERSAAAVWSIYGNNKMVERKEKKIEPVSAGEAKPESVIRKSGKYVPKKDFGTLLGEYTASHPISEPVARKRTDEKPVMDNPFFIKEGDEESRSSSAVWSIYGSNEAFRRPNADKKAENEKPMVEIRRSAPYVPQEDFSTLLSEYGEGESFDEIMKKKGIAEAEERKLTISELRTMLPEATLDLHGLTEAEAEKAVREFLLDAEKEKLRKISVIHGKGLHSESGVCVLKNAVDRVLNESGVVSEAFSPKAQYGGSGALWIILKENQRSR